MFKMVPFSTDLDLSDFYKSAKERGYVNNSSQHMIYDCFINEREHQTWILYYNNIPIGSCAAHSFDEMGRNSYRILTRTCVFTDKINGVYGSNLRTLSVITEHQNPTGQFYIPTCIEWAGKDSKLFMTSNSLEGGSQRKVHKIYFPALEKTGQVDHICDMQYRGTMQSVWQLNVKKYCKVLNQKPRWI